MDNEEKSEIIFMNNFYKILPELKKEFRKFLVEKKYFDPKTDGFSYQMSMGLSFFILELFKNNRHEDLKKIFNFIEDQVGIDSDIDESIEVLIFEGIMNVIKGDDKDNNTHQFKEFEKLLGSKSIQLCRKNEALWDSLDREPKSLGNMIRFLKERNQ